MTRRKQDAPRVTESYAIFRSTVNQLGEFHGSGENTLQEGRAGSFPWKICPRERTKSKRVCDDPLSTKLVVFVCDFQLITSVHMNCHLLCLELDDIERREPQCGCFHSQLTSSHRFNVFPLLLTQQVSLGILIGDLYVPTSAAAASRQN